MNLGAISLAALAGVLSILSPCVLPMLPLAFGGAASQGRMAPVLLALGVALSFTTVSIFVATIGFSIGLDGEALRGVGAALIAGLGVVLLWPPLQTRVVAALGPLSDRIDRAFHGASVVESLGPLGLGATLGAVWSPCAGPTLGAASLMASRGESLGQAALIMGAFGLGAAAPLLGLGLLSREVFSRWRDSLIGAGLRARQAMGVFLIVLGGLIVSGRDKQLEATLLDASPAWLSQLTTRF